MNFDGFSSLNITFEDQIISVAWFSKPLNMTRIVSAHQLNYPPGNLAPQAITCTICSNIFTTREALTRHCTRIHPNSNVHHIRIGSHQLMHPMPPPVRHQKRTREPLCLKKFTKSNNRHIQQQHGDITVHRMLTSFPLMLRTMTAPKIELRVLKVCF